MLAVKSGFILFIKNYQFPLQINTLERERERERVQERPWKKEGNCGGRARRGVETERIGPILFGCICCAAVVHVHGAPCAAILVLSCIWKDLRVCLVLESTCAGSAGLPSARYPRNGLTCLVRVYLLCCCGACLRRSLRYHTFAFIHLERFDGLSCARKSSRRLRRFALGSTSKERPCSAWPGRLSPWTGFCISLLHAFAYCLLRIFVCLCDACCASCNLRPVPHPSLLPQQRAGLAKDSH